MPNLDTLIAEEKANFRSSNLADIEYWEGRGREAGKKACKELGKRLAELAMKQVEKSTLVYKKE